MTMLSHIVIIVLLFEFLRSAWNAFCLFVMDSVCYHFLPFLSLCSPPFPTTLTGCLSGKTNWLPKLRSFICHRYSLFPYAFRNLIQERVGRAINRCLIKMPDVLVFYCLSLSHPFSFLASPLSLTDGSDLMSSWRRIRSFPNGTLSLIDAESEDEGWFRCEAGNSDGLSASSSFYLHVVGSFSCLSFDFMFIFIPSNPIST